MTINFQLLGNGVQVFIIVEVMIKQLNVNLSETMWTTCSKRVNTEKIHIVSYLFGFLKKGTNTPLWRKGSAEGSNPSSVWVRILVGVLIVFKK